jgi:hypothetical protein
MIGGWKPPPGSRRFTWLEPGSRKLLDEAGSTPICFDEGVDGGQAGAIRECRKSSFRSSAARPFAP